MKGASILMVDGNVNGDAKPDTAEPATAKKDAEPPPATEPLQFATKEQFDKLNQMVYSLSRLLKKQEKTENSPAEPVQKSLGLEERIKAIDEREKRLRARTVRETLDSEFRKHGIDPDFVEDARRRFMDEHGKSIDFDDEDTPTVSVNDERLKIGAVIESLIKSKAYDRYRPAVKTPQTGPNGKPESGRPKMSKAEYNRRLQSGEQALILMKNYDVQFFDAR